MKNCDRVVMFTFDVRLVIVVTLSQGVALIFVCLDFVPREHLGGRICSNRFLSIIHTTRRREDGGDIIIIFYYFSIIIRYIIFIIIIIIIPIIFY